MSKGKKGIKATPDAVSWDEGLLNAAVQEDDWRPCVVFVCPSTPHDEPHIAALCSAASTGTRRRFTVIDKTAMLQSASEDVKLAQTAGGGGKKSKAATTSPVERPMFVEVCEHVVDAMRGGAPLPPSLLTKMIKYKVLRRRAMERAEVARKEAEMAAQKQAAEKGGEGKGGKGGKAGGGRTSKAGGGKKGKDTPAVDAAPAIPLPEKPPTSMRKRGEEDLDSKYIDDEPTDGPTCYFLMTGFSSLDLLEQLTPVGLTAHVLMKVTGSQPPETQTSDEDEEEQRREREQHGAELASFWRGLGQCVRATDSGHMLRDMAQVEEAVPQPLVPGGCEQREAYGQAFFDTAAQNVFRVLEQSTQYQHYLSYLNLRQLTLPCAASEESSGPSLNADTSTSLISLPPQSVAVETEYTGAVKVDTRLYTELLSSVPQNAITIPLMLHCMEEQVCATLSAASASPPSLQQQALHSDVSAQITDCITGLCIPADAKKNLLPDGVGAGHTDQKTGQKVTKTIEYWDRMSLLSHDLTESKLLSIGSSQAGTNSRALLGSVLELLAFSADQRNPHLAQLHAVQHFCCMSHEVSAQLLNHALLVLSLEHVHLPNASSFPDLKLNLSSPSACNTAQLQFDFPLAIALKEKHTSDSVALVPYTNEHNGTASVNAPGEREQSRYELDLPAPRFSLAKHTVCEPMSKSALVQLLQSLQLTHPYLSVYSHKLSQSTVLVAHSGFDGRPMHTHTWQSLAHSRVGFNNYLQYIAGEFGAEIDRAVEEDEQRRAVFEEERQRLVEEKRKELEQQQQQQLESVKEVSEEQLKASAKGGKKSAASAKKTAVLEKTVSGKHSQLDQASATPDSTIDVTESASLAPFQERKLYEAYDVGDIVLLDRGSVVVQFISDGSQVRIEKIEQLESRSTVTASAIANGHIVSCSVIKDEAKEEEKRAAEADGGKENQSKGEEERGTAQGEAAVTAGIPQPPPGVEFASLRAEFRDSLAVSVSHFGPKGNGEPPFELHKPEILLEPAVRPDSSLDSRPQSRQTPQKMNKKQMEQQQQLLEQQRKLEEQREKERRMAQETYENQCSALLRHNKYQQLFASTPYGLHVHCQVTIDLEADPSITNGSDGSVIVRQSYPIQSQGIQACEASLTGTAYNEVERYYLPDGSVLRFLKGGSMVVLCADGHVYQTATESLRDLYHRQLHEEDQGGEDTMTESAGLGAVEHPSPQTTLSSTKVTFADQLDKILTDKTGGSEASAEAVWVVTAPRGERYLWKRPPPHETTHDDEKTEKKDSEASPEKKTGTAAEDSPNTVVPEPDLEVQPQLTIVPLPSVKVFPATDPVTKEILISREDNVTMLRCPDGCFITEHADGTRISTIVRLNNNKDDPSTPVEVMTECPGFARVTHTQSRQCYIQFPDGSAIASSTAGHYTVEKKDDYRLEVKPSGESQCTLHRQSTAYLFTLDHTGANDLLTASSKATSVKFSVGQDGTPAVSREDSVPFHPAFSPRYFVVPSNGLPYQILDQAEMDSFLTAAEAHPDTTVVKDAPVPGFEGTAVAVMKALRREIPAILPYKKESIIPKNLASNPAQRGQTPAKGTKRFGVGVGKSLSIKTSQSGKAVQQVEVPDALQCRQFLYFDQLNDSLREQICNGLASYIASRQQEQSTEDDLLPVDLRDASEQEAAKHLRAQWVAKLSDKALTEKFHEAQQQNELKMASRLNVKAQGKSNTSRILNGIKHDLEQAEQNRQALRNRTVSPYFESEKGQQFLRSQSPDMTVLALQLARPPKTQSASCAPPDATSEVSRSSTPSTLHSASVVLPPMGAESPDVGEVDTASLSSVSKIRPAHPTPDHAQGMHTPTNVRPTNPTPFHAGRTHSPTMSIVSQADTFQTGTQSIHMDTIDAALESDSNTERTVSFTLPPSSGKPSQNVTGRSYIASTQGSSAAKSRVQSKPRGGTPGSRPNTKFGEVEEAVRRKVHTCSTMSGGLLRGFEVQPQSLDFGVVREGCTYVHSLTLRNVGIDSCRFKIKQPPPSTGIKVVYTPGPVAAGMSRQCDVELFAIAVGVVGSTGTGHVDHVLEIVSEANILQIPIRASVLTSASDSSPQPQLPAIGVRQVDRPSSREDFTRPPRLQE